jgi:cytochrome c556
MKSIPKSLPAVLAATLAFAAAGTAIAQAQPRPEQLIKWRQSAFQLVAWNSGRIKANLDAGYNKEQVVKSANALAAIANSGLGALFPAGTETGKGWHETSAKPELFKESDKFAAAGIAFAHEADELARVAAGGDAAAVKEQFGKVQRTCKSCHDEFRKAD